MTETRVELVFDGQCPHVGEARALLRDVLGATGLPVEWREWEIGAPGTPESMCALGSPTILVDGVDVSGEDPRTNAEVAGGDCCRVYRGERGGLRGVPPRAMLVHALARSATDSTHA